MIERRFETYLAGAVWLAVACGAVDVSLLQMTHWSELLSLIPFPALSTIVCAFVWFRMRLIRRADQERFDNFAAREEPHVERMFDSRDPLEPFPAARNRAEFERVAVFLFAPILAIVEGLCAWWLFESMETESTATPNRVLFASAILGGQAFLLFLSSRFLLGLARDPSHRFLRGPGTMLGVTCLATATFALAGILGESIAQAYGIAFRILTGILILLAIEHVMNFIGEIYRPRRNSSINLTYESRWGRRLSDPGGWVKTMARSLDYQFGSGASQTWYDRCLRRVIIPLVFFQIGALYLLSSIVFIGPEEEGIRERFGRPLKSNGYLDSGMHFKWPWPFESVRRFPSKRLLEMHIGYSPELQPSNNPVVLWSEHPQTNEDLFLVASRIPGDNFEGDDTVPVSFLNVHFPIEYRITNIYQYAYQCSEPDRVLKEIAIRCFSLQAAGSDLRELLTTRQENVLHRLRLDIQKSANVLGLGIEIVSIGLQGVHPPAAVVGAFESVMGAKEEKETIIFKAQSYAAAIVPITRALHESHIRRAEAYRFSRSELAFAETDRFRQQVKGYGLAPSVYRTRSYLNMVSGTLAEPRKYIIGPPASREIIELNFEESIRPDLFDLSESELEETTP